MSTKFLIFGVLPFFILLFEAWVIRCGFENINGERFPRIIFLLAFLIGLVPVINFAISAVLAGIIIYMALNQDCGCRIRNKKGLLYWLFRQD